MRDPSCNGVVSVIDLDEHGLVRPLPVLEVPSVSRVRKHSKDLFLMVRVNHIGGYEVSVRHAIGVSYRQWVFEDGLQRPPDLNFPRRLAIHGRSNIDLHYVR